MSHIIYANELFLGNFRNNTSNYKSITNKDFYYDKLTSCRFPEHALRGNAQHTLTQPMFLLLITFLVLTFFFFNCLTYLILCVC